ncbi:hypothetical protein BKA81DRAFT_363654 [Phyllosticta paracitricarpa]
MGCAQQRKIPHVIEPTDCLDAVGQGRSGGKHPRAIHSLSGLAGLLQPGRVDRA